MKKESTNSETEYIGYIYKIVNKINSKVYIGETLVHPKKRLHQHCTSAYREQYWNYYFYRSIRKYGKENFELTILYEYRNVNRKEVKKKILELEEQYILEYDSFKNGYNSNSGGRHPLETSLETRQLQSKRKKEDPKTKERLKYAKSFYHNEKKVKAYNYDTGELIRSFNSVKEASIYYNIDRSGIVKVCKKITNFLGRIEDIRITWRYEEDSYEVPYIVKVYNLDGELLNKFINYADAARFYNIRYQETIVRCCQGKCNSTGRKKEDKLIWRFINDDFILNK